MQVQLAKSHHCYHAQFCFQNKRAYNSKEKDNPDNVLLFWLTYKYMDFIIILSAEMTGGLSNRFDRLTSSSSTHS